MAPQSLIETKRSERLKESAAALPWPENVWMGVSVEDSRVLSRIEDLLAVPATVPFFFKQWGGARKKAAGRRLNGRTYDELPRGGVEEGCRMPR